MHLIKYKLIVSILCLLVVFPLFSLCANASEANSSKNLSDPNPDTIVRVSDYFPELRQSLIYASEDNPTGRQIYDFTDAYLRYGTVKKLAAVNKELSTFDLGILILDAYRPLDCQEQLLKLYSEDMLLSTYVDDDSLHCHGNTVDVVLVDFKTGERTPSPTRYKDFTALTDRDFEDCPAEGILYAVILEDIMKKHGFEPCSEKWWQFTDTTDYPLEKYFYPAPYGTWVANCKSRLEILSAPYSEPFWEAYARVKAWEYWDGTADSPRFPTKESGDM